MTLFHNVFFSGDDGEANKQKNGASYHNSNRTLLFSGYLFFTFFLNRVWWMFLYFYSDDHRTWKSRCCYWCIKYCYWSFYINNLNFWKHQLCCPLWKNYLSCTVLVWHCTEINSHIGLEMFNIIFSICRGVMHCIKYIRS